VEFIYPSNGDKVVEGTDLTFDLLAQDSSAGIEKIALFHNEEVLREVSPPNGIAESQFRVEVNWLAQGTGLHAFSAIAYRSGGGESRPVYLSIEIIPFPASDSDMPVVEIISPASGVQVSEGTEVNVELRAADQTIGIARIVLLVDGEMFDEALMPNYQVAAEFEAQITWVAEGIGAHELSAIGYRADGTPSEEVSINIEVGAP
jgi:hypothetical protein